MTAPETLQTAVPATTRWYAMSDVEVEAALDTRADGLTEDEAARRLAAVGPNEVEAERVTPWWRLLLRQFFDPLIYILLIAAGVTLALRDYSDAAVILAVVVINAVIGFTQEVRAREAIRGLARLSAPKAEIVRDGVTRVVEGRTLVPGDVVVLSSGARIPADLRLTSVRALDVDESMLTGESVPSYKTTGALGAAELVPGDQTNLTFAGTIVTRGRGRGWVVRTGAATELGRIATEIGEVGQTATPLQEKMRRFGRQVGQAVIGLGAVVLVIGLLRGLSPAAIFLTAVAMAVSAIPEGLPVVLTVTLAIGVARMARRNAIVRALPAVETLGSTTVIGSDKTGTLTKNEMTVREIWTADATYAVTGSGYDLDGRIERDGRAITAEHDTVLCRALRAAVLANEANAGSVEAEAPLGDPTEIALLVAAVKAGVTPSELRRRHAELDLLPFEPERRFMASLNETPGAERCIHIKGAPEAVIRRCDHQLTRDGKRPLDAAAIRDAARELGARGLRVLAMAEKPTEAADLDTARIEDGFTFLGLAGMEDPVRPEAIEAIGAAHGAGIRVLMLTGDHAHTAQAIGRQLRLGGASAAVIEGHELEHLADDQLDSVLDKIDIYARVAPEHKLRLVQRLEKKGEVIAVTGDGVNDAPALRAAHLGIAMGASGTDVAREASDIILADDNFATITAAVEEGRTVFSNIRKVSFFLLSTAVAEVLAIIVTLVAGWPLPFIAAQILWINLVTNGLQDVALAFEPGEPGQLTHPPRARNEGIVSLRILQRFGGVGALFAAGTLGMFWWSLEMSGGDLVHARTVAMTQMVVFQFFHAFNCRSLDRSVFRMPLLGNRFLFLSLAAALLAHLAALHIAPLQAVFETQPLAASEWGLIALIGSTGILGGELDKWWNRHRGVRLG